MGAILHDRILRLPAVKDRTGLSRSSIYQKMAANQFPKNIKMGRLSGWIEHEIDTWINQQIAQSRGEVKHAA